MGKNEKNKYTVHNSITYSFIVRIYMHEDRLAETDSLINRKNFKKGKQNILPRVNVFQPLPEAVSERKPNKLKMCVLLINGVLQWFM